MLNPNMFLVNFKKVHAEHPLKTQPSTATLPNNFPPRVAIAGIAGPWTDRAGF